MKRQVVISKFRNLGLDKEDKLVINNSLEKGKMGNVVILIGQNNAGKSNVLDALYKSSNGGLQDRDITDLSYDEKDRVPSLSYEIKDNDCLVMLKTNLNDHKYSFEIPLEDLGFTKKDVIEYFKTINTVYSNNGWRDSELSKFINETENNKNLEFEKVLSDAQALMKSLISGSRLSNYIRYDTSLKQSPVYNYLTGNFNVDEYLTKKYGYNPYANVIRYEETSISSHDLTTIDINNISNHRFFGSLLKKIGIKDTELKAVYENYSKSNNITIFKNFNKKLEKKMLEINSVFNKLYFAGNDKYQFLLECHQQGISLGLGRGEEGTPINIEYQSTGFKWFFNLFFSYGLNNQLKPGSVIIMDEPAHNLHPAGQRELRNFLKDFAKANDITFVISTHSPFLIDVDNLDELRVVSMEDNKSHIDNLFSAVNGDDPDSLLPIKEALTIKQNVFYDFDTRVIWVEGISDYNYLTLFKKLLNKDKIAFIPFNGVGNNKEMTNKILEKIINIKFHKYGMLVDGDKAGKDMYAQCQNTIFKDRVCCVSDLNEESGKKFITIEDLFSDNDKAKHSGLDYKKDNEFKKAYLSSYMKNNCSLEDFDEETVNNFKKLFDLLEE